MLDATEPTAQLPPPHHDLVASKLPAWLVNAPPEQRQHMRKAASTRDPQLERACEENPAVAQALVHAYGQHLKAEAALKALLATVPELQQYATDLLSKAVQKRFCDDANATGSEPYCVPIDVTKACLLNLSRAADIRIAIATPGEDPLINSSRALKMATQSLLHSALQNFEAYEAEPGGLGSGGRKSVILDRKDVSGASEAVQLPIVAEDFCALARELDIGGKYQSLLDSLAPPADHADAEAVREVFRAAERSTFYLHVHHAYLLGKIDQAIYEILLKLYGDSTVIQGGLPVLWPASSYSTPRLPVPW